MSMPPFDLLEDPALLAQLQIWTEPVYRDLLAVERGELDEFEFRQRYLHRKAILVLDISGFTEAGVRLGEVNAFLRILNVHKVCDPILRRRGATLVRAFADDLVALFEDPNVALDAAFELHARVNQFSQQLREPLRATCCIGIGYGEVFAIGPNLAMGNEMNRASKLGEDTAVAGETLLTENTYAATRYRADLHFEAQTSNGLSFPYVRATPADFAN